TVPPASSHPMLRFRHWYDFSNYDYGEVQIRSVGQESWKVLGHYTNNSSNQFTYPLIDSLLPYCGLDIELCFFFYSSAGGYSPSVAPGWYIDDIKVVLTGPYIYCPPDTVSATTDGPGMVCFPLQIWNAAGVTVSNSGTWANDTA